MADDDWPLPGRTEGTQDVHIRTFLIADVRGYTLFTQERGDEAATKLAARFANVAREVVEEHGGSVIELRGDEALAAFNSAADICVRSGPGGSDEVIDAVGPETFTFEELVRLIARAIGRRTLFVHVPRAAALTAATAIGRLVGDVVVTKEELEGLMAELVTTEGPATGTRALTEWLAQNAAVVGKRYASEVSRHYSSPARTGGHFR